MGAAFTGYLQVKSQGPRSGHSHPWMCLCLLSIGRTMVGLEGGPQAGTLQPRIPPLQNVHTTETLTPGLSWPPS